MRHTLRKLIVHTGCAKEIFFPQNPGLELLELGWSSRTQTAHHLESLTGLRFIGIGGCNVLPNFDFIRHYNQTFYLNITTKRELGALDFMDDHNPVTTP